jgi:hypothetical protein
MCRTLGLYREHLLQVVRESGKGVEEKPQSLLESDIAFTALTLNWGARQQGDSIPGGWGEFRPWRVSRHHSMYG